MKPKILILGIVIVAAAVGAFYLFRSSSATCQHLLPKDALALARIDVNRFLTEAGLTNDEKAQLFRRHLPAGAKDTDPGIDLSQPVYGFADRDGNFGLAAAVSDADNLTSWCNAMAANGHATEVSRQRGLSWTVVEQQWLMAFDDDRAVVMGPAVGSAQDRLRTVIAQLMKQDGDASAAETPIFKLLDTADAPVVAAVKPELLPEQTLGVMSSLHFTSSEQGLYRLTMTPDDETLTATVDIVTDDAELQAELRQWNTRLRPLEASLTGKLHADPALWMAVNTRGEELLKLLRSDTSVRTALLTMNMIADVDLMIQTVDGEVALEFDPTSGTSTSDLSKFKGVSLVAQLSDTDFLSRSTSWGNGFVGITSLSPTDFFVNAYGLPIYFGVQDQLLYVGWQRGLIAEDNAYLRQQVDEIRGSRLFVTLHIPSLTIEPFSMLSLRFPELDRLDVKMGDAGAFTFTLKALPRTNITKHLLLQ